MKVVPCPICKKMYQAPEGTVSLQCAACGQIYIAAEGRWFRPEEIKASPVKVSQICDRVVYLASLVECGVRLFDFLRAHRPGSEMSDEALAGWCASRREIFASPQYEAFRRAITPLISEQREDSVLSISITLAPDQPLERVLKIQEAVEASLRKKAGSSGFRFGQRDFQIYYYRRIDAEEAGRLAISVLLREGLLKRDLDVRCYSLAEDQIWVWDWEATKYILQAVRDKSDAKAPTPKTQPERYCLSTPEFSTQALVVLRDMAGWECEIRGDTPCGACCNSCIAREFAQRVLAEIDRPSVAGNRPDEGPETPDFGRCDDGESVP